MCLLVEIKVNKYSVNHFVNSGARTVVRFLVTPCKDTSLLTGQKKTCYVWWPMWGLIHPHKAWKSGPSGSLGIQRHGSLRGAAVYRQALEQLALCTDSCFRQTQYIPRAGVVKCYSGVGTPQHEARLSQTRGAEPAHRKIVA